MKKPKRYCYISNSGYNHDKHRRLCRRMALIGKSITDADDILPTR